ncbi:MAG: nickel-responsive transcriptional regulator NikR [Pseudomonadales bacterium]
MAGLKNQGNVERISVSLPGPLLARLDEMVAARGHESRSQAVAEMIRRSLATWGEVLGNGVMAGTITLVYDRSVHGLQTRLADLQHQHIDEVISSLHVQLEQAQTMEVILVQGPAIRLRAIADAMATLRGVATGHLQLTTAIIPPLHRKGESI